MWYVRQFDRSWVRCANHHCRTEFSFASIEHKRKCPRCKLANDHTLPKGAKDDRKITTSVSAAAGAEPADTGTACDSVV